MIRTFVFWLGLACAGSLMAEELAILPRGASAGPLLPIEEQVAEMVKTSKVTVVHFWATWCPNCRAELSRGGWDKFVETNPNVNVIFVTIRSDEAGAPILAKYGLGKQKNFRELRHPNPSRLPDTEMTSFLGLRVGWVPATWIFCDGRLRFALNYGELRFPILQQFVEDARQRE